MINFLSNLHGEDLKSCGETLTDSQKQELVKIAMDTIEEKVKSLEGVNLTLLPLIIESAAQLIDWVNDDSEDWTNEFSLATSYIMNKEIQDTLHGFIPKEFAKEDK